MTGLSFFLSRSSRTFTTFEPSADPTAAQQLIRKGKEGRTHFLLGAPGGLVALLQADHGLGEVVLLEGPLVVDGEEEGVAAGGEDVVLEGHGPVVRVHHVHLPTANGGKGAWL